MNTYNNKLIMASFIRGYLKSNNIKHSLLDKDLLSLSDNDINELEKLGKELELKLYYFKEKDILPRVNIVLGFLKNIYPETLLDVGSGRGVFLFPLLNEFPSINVTSIDILDKRIELLSNISKGGVNNLKVIKDDICTFNEADNSYQVVTLLEVLEHIKDYQKAIKNAIRLSSDFIVITVPSKEDNNPEHINLLTKDILTKEFNKNNITNLKFSSVNNHLVLVARKKA